MAYGSKRWQLDKARAEAIAKSVQVASLCKVVEFYPDRMEADLQPLVKANVQDKYESQPPLLSVPVLCLTFGDFVIRPWLTPGEIGLVVHLDADSDAALSQGDEAEPQTARNHAPDDGVFIAGVKSVKAAVPPGIPGKSLVLCAKAGDVYIAVKANGIESKADWTHEGNIDITGNMTVKGNITVTGGDVTADGVSLKKHVHGGVDAGPGSTGPPH